MTIGIIKSDLGVMFLNERKRFYILNRDIASIQIFCAIFMHHLNSHFVSIYNDNYVANNLWYFRHEARTSRKTVYCCPIKYDTKIILCATTLHTHTFTYFNSSLDRNCFAIRFLINYLEYKLAFKINLVSKKSYDIGACLDEETKCMLFIAGNNKDNRVY